MKFKYSSDEQPQNMLYASIHVCQIPYRVLGGREEEEERGGRDKGILD